MSPLVDEFVSSKKLAVVGMSRNSKKFGNMAAKELLSRGYQIFPVHKMAKEIDGMPCSPDLKSLEGQIDALWISISPKEVSAVLEDAHQAGIKRIWLQQGAWSKEVQETIDKLGIQVVTKRCILMYAPPVKSIHKFHRTIKSLFGGL